MAHASSSRLTRLIGTTNEANGWNDADLAKRMTRAGHDLNKSRLSTLKLEGMKYLAGRNVGARRRSRAAREGSGPSGAG